MIANKKLQKIKILEQSSELLQKRNLITIFGKNFLNESIRPIMFFYTISSFSCCSLIKKALETQ